MKQLFYILLGALLMVGSTAYALSVFVVPQGGTGQSTFTSSQLIYGNGTAALSSVATTSVTCTGSASCTAFTAIGPSPISISVSGGGGGSGNVATSTTETQGFLAYWTSTGATPATLGKVATSSLGVTGPITYSGTIGAQVGGTTGNFGCTNASSGVTGCLPGTDWTTFNNKIGWGQATSTSANQVVYTNSNGLLISVASSSLNLPNAALTNSTISGIALGSNLNSLTINNGGAGAASGATYNGSSGVTISYNTIGAQVAGTYATFGWEWTPLTNYAINTNSTTTAISLTKGVFASSTSQFDQINVGSTTLGTMSTSTNFGNQVVSGNASSTRLTVSNVSSALLVTNSAGSVSAYGGSANCTNQVVNGISALGAGNCVSVANAMLSNSVINYTYSGNITGPASIALGASGQLVVGYDWVPFTNFGANTNSTSTALTFKAGFFASSTTATPSWIDQLNIGSTTSGTLATSTDFGNFMISGNASTTNLFISTLTSGNLVKATTGGKLVPTTLSDGSGTNGNCVKWGANNALSDFGSACGGSGSPAGPTNSFQFNNGGSFFGATTFTYSNTGATNGNIGLGTTTPWGQLSVSATSTGWMNQPIFVVASSSSGTATSTLFTVSPPSGTKDILDVDSLTGSVFFSVPNVGYAANTVLGNNTGNTGTFAAFGTSTIFNWSSGFNTSGSTITQNEHHSFTYATTTWTGTTTIPLEIGYGETWNSIQCFTDIGTLNTQVGYGSASTTMFNASTTIGTVSYASNNLMTAGNKVKVDIGTPATAPTKITCTEKDTY